MGGENPIVQNENICVFMFELPYLQDLLTMSAFPVPLPRGASKQ